MSLIDFVDKVGLAWDYGLAEFFLFVFLSSSLYGNPLYTSCLQDSSPYRCFNLLPLRPIKRDKRGQKEKESEKKCRALTGEREDALNFTKNLS